MIARSDWLLMSFSCGACGGRSRVLVFLIRFESVLPGKIYFFFSGIVDSSWKAVIEKLSGGLPFVAKSRLHSDAHLVKLKILERSTRATSRGSRMTWVHSQVHTRLHTE